MSSRRNEIRCICGRRPLLATYGVDARGKIFIHVRVFKQSRIFGEVWVTADAAADVRLRCRECLRVQKIKIVNDRPLLEEEREMMESIGTDPNAPPFAHDARDR